MRTAVAQGSSAGTTTTRALSVTRLSKYIGKERKLNLERSRNSVDN